MTALHPKAHDMQIPRSSDIQRLRRDGSGRCLSPQEHVSRTMGVSDHMVSRIRGHCLTVVLSMSSSKTRPSSLPTIYPPTNMEVGNDS